MIARKSTTKPRKSKKDGKNWSVPVLIDLDGWRKNFRTGFYSFSAKRWFLLPLGTGEKVNTRQMRWFYIEQLDED